MNSGPLFFGRTNTTFVNVKQAAMAFGFCHRGSDPEKSDTRLLQPGSIQSDTLKVFPVLIE